MRSTLFTSVGRRVELVRAFKQAYTDLGMDGQIVAADIDPLAPALQLADRPYIVPHYNSPEYIPTLVKICEREHVKLILPLIDPDIPILAQASDDFARIGAHVASVTAKGAAITADKWLTQQFFLELGLPSAKSWLPNMAELQSQELPLFIKPRSGSAAKHTYKINTADELAFFLQYVPDPIIQEFLSGAEITSDVICDPGGEILSIVSRKRIEVRWGEVAKGVTIYERTITEGCIKIAKALCARGPITVQCILHEGVPIFTEINARLGGGVPLGIAAGADYPRWLLARANGIPIDIPPLGSYQVGLYLTRYDESLFVTSKRYEQLAGHTFRSG